LLYSRCRRIALTVGEHLVHDGTLDSADDVFFLTYPELDEFLSGNAMFPEHVYSTVAARKRAHHEWLQMSLPDTFECPEGEYASDAHLNITPISNSDEEMNGIGACGGRVTAPAAVLESVGDAENLRQGDVLVTRQTDPGWAPVFFLIRGLVIERGGMLSHGAIIAREFGLPCVVGVKNATQRIPHRCMLSVNGDHGHVRIMD
jgi:pyruvate,water dikinase